MSGANSFKFVLLPPQSDTTRDWAKRLAEISVPEARVIVAEDADTAAREIVDAEAAFGWLGSDLLLKATKLRWLQAPQAAPPAGYYYPELIAHSVVVTNFRDLQRPHRRPHLGFCAGFRTRAAYLHPAAIAARVEEKPGRERQRCAPAGSDSTDGGQLPGFRRRTRIAQCGGQSRLGFEPGAARRWRRIASTH